MALPTFLIIGAMKCGTSALHDYLRRHPDVQVSQPKELNFFLGPDEPHGDPGPGNWHRGPDWYAGHFDPAAPARGEASPGYTSPDHPEAAGRIAELLPRAHLLYCVRDPLARAVSQYRHHVADGTETRAVEEALLDPDSQYVARSRYFARVEPYLRRFPPDRVTVVVAEALAARPRAEAGRVLAAIGVDPGAQPADPPARVNAARVDAPPLPERVRRRFVAAVRDDVEALRAHTGSPLEEWCV